MIVLASAVGAVGALSALPRPRRGGRGKTAALIASCKLSEPQSLGRRGLAAGTAFLTTISVVEVPVATAGGLNRHAVQFVDICWIFEY